MQRTVLVSLALAAVPVASAGPQGVGAPLHDLELSAARFYRASSGQTVVDAFCQVPFTILAPLAPGGGGGRGVVAAYRVAVSVRDAGGLELVTQAWSRQVAASLLSTPRGSSAEHFSFAAHPGRYTVVVVVTDSATGREFRDRVEVVAYDTAPAASDLLLATSLRASGGGPPGPGEIRKGAVVLQATGMPALTPHQGRLGYYLEMYPSRPETLAVVARVRTADGAEVVATAPQQVQLPEGGGVTQATIDLAGLPPGDYRLQVVAGGDVTREAPFRMAGFETAEAIAEATDRFGMMTEAQLDTVYLPVVYLMTAEEQGTYPGLTLDGKRRWLRQFWQKRDPTAGTAQNEAQEDFYTRINEATRRFREGGSAAIPGWRTDRGRIFVKYGPPDEVLRRPQAGDTRPYEVWKYTQARPLKYVFLDQTLFGNYVLIWTDDRRELSRPNWQELLGPEAVTDVVRF